MGLENSKYNFVVFGSDDELYRVSYSELNKYRNVHCIMNYLDVSNKAANYLFRVHSSAASNRLVDLPFKEIWNPLIFRHKFDYAKPICFIFFSRNQLCNERVISYLKRKYPGSKFVAFWQDLVKYVPMKHFDHMVHHVLDLCLTFDHSDAEKYGMHYYPLVYSPLEKENGPVAINSDIYFLGKAKDRLTEILHAYEKFRQAGLKCDFHIVGVEKEKRKYADEIDYCDSMTYLDNIQHLRQSKCLLEVMQGGGRGYTIRYAEAIMYDKKIITNNSEVQNAPFYDSQKIQHFNCVDEIDPLFPTIELEDKDYHYKDNLLPSKMLLYVEELLLQNAGNNGEYNM